LIFSLLVLTNLNKKNEMKLYKDVDLG